MSQIKGMGELDQVNTFSDGLKLATRQEVKYQAPAMLEEAWKLAVQYDTAMFSEGKVTKSNGKLHPTVEYHTENGQTNHTPVQSQWS